MARNEERFLRCADRQRGPGGKDRPSTAPLPTAMQTKAVRRLGLLAAALGGVAAFGLAGRLIAIWLGVPEADRDGATINAFAFALIALSAAMWWQSRRDVEPGLMLRVGHHYIVLMCLGMAVVEHLYFDFLAWPPRISFITPILLAYPLVIPWSPRWTAGTMVCCLSTLPMAAGIQAALEGGWTHPATVPLYWVPTVSVGLLGLALAPVVHGLHRQAGRALRMGSYELIELLGSGGMGEVWRARHQLLVRPAAVKLIRPDRLGSDPVEAMGRFEREAQATSALRSPHTVELYDFGTTDDGAFYYAMELLDGVDLQTLVSRFGPVPAARTVHILQQACRSLADAHQRGMVHRDVKPANVLVCRLGIERDFVKVLDFGLVKAVTPGSQADLKLTQAGSTSGTPAFMAPEQALGEEVGPPADVYALGCVAFWLLTGRLVFEADSALQLAMKHATAEPPRPSEHTELSVPPGLDELVTRCLAKAPADRPADAHAVYRALDDLGLDEPWTEARAERWWTTHLPAAATAA